MARQPILDADGVVFAYELLFRSSWRNVFDGSDQDRASSRVIADSSLVFDLQSVTGGKKAFINVTREVLLEEYILTLPREKTVVEILETVEPDAEVVDACRKLKAAGYGLALDDFVYSERLQPLVDLADFIKVDVLATGREDRCRLMERCRESRAVFLAEKVETWEEFEACRELGFRLFQGFYFCRPSILTGQEISGSRLNYLQVLEAVGQEDLDFQRIEALIKREVSLAYKLLRFINSAFFSFRVTVESIGRALTLMGEARIRKWVSLSVLLDLAQDRVDELVIQAVLRGRFCELLAPLLELGKRADDLFLMGMFSLLDAILESSMPPILERLPIAEDVKRGLLARQGRMGELLQLVEALEAADWVRQEELGRRLGLQEQQMAPLYRQSMEWCHSLMTQVAAA